MKVLVVTGIFPPDHGGPASYVPFIADAFIKRGHDVVSVVTLSDCINENEIYSFPVLRILRGGLRFLRFFKTIYIISKLAKSSDIVYLNGLVLEGIVACKIFARKPTVIKVVGDLIWEKARNRKSSSLELEEFQIAKLSLYWTFLRYLQRLYSRFADAVIVPSKYLGGIVNQWGVSSNKVDVVYNAVSIDESRTKILSEQPYDLVTVARLVPWKGLSDLVRLSSEINCSLLIVGDGPIRKELEDQVRKFNARVDFVGNVPHDAVAGKIKSGKLFVLNSTYEGLPHIILEAKATSTAVLASSAGGTVETINHGIDGLLIPVGDFSKLKESVTELLENRKMRFALAEAGFNHVKKDFGIDLQIDSTIKVLQKICGKK